MSLFDQTSRDIPSTLASRRVSKYAGQVVRIKYKVKWDVSSYETYARLLDLQPTKNEAGDEGVRLLFRRMTANKEGVLSNDKDIALRDMTLGPFARVVKFGATRKTSDADEDAEPEVLESGVERFGLSGRADSGVEHELTLGFYKGL